PHDVTGEFAAVVERITREPPRSARSVDRTVDRDLDAILARAIARDPAQRYATADAFAADVEHWLRVEPVAARGRSSSYVVMKWLVRRRLRVALVAVALSIAISGGVLFFRQRAKAARSAQTALDVRAVLLDLLEAARPDRMGPAVPLPEILAEAAVRLD